MRLNPDIRSVPECSSNPKRSIKAIPASQVRGRWILRTGNSVTRASFPGAQYIQQSLRGRSDTQDCGSRPQQKDDNEPRGNITKGPRSARPDKTTFLPPELIAMIFTHVLEMESATGRLFLFTRLGQSIDLIDDAQKKSQPMVQQYTFHSSPTISITRYALVCQAWRDTVYAGFYGSPKNFFHFHFTAMFYESEDVSGVDEVGPHCWVQVFPPGPQPTEGEMVPERATGDVDERATERGQAHQRTTTRFNSMFSPDDPRGMTIHNFTHPLTSGTAPWIHYATVSIRMLFMQLATHNDKLLELVDGLVDLLGGRAARLKQLAVWLHYDHPHMTISRAQIADFSDNDEEEDEESDERKMIEEYLIRRRQVIVGFGSRRPVDYVAPRHNTTARVLNPLFRLRGLREFTVSGLVTEKLARELTEAVTLNS